MVGEERGRPQSSITTAPGQPRGIAQLAAAARGLRLGQCDEPGGSRREWEAQLPFLGWGEDFKGSRVSQFWVRPRGGALAHRRPKICPWLFWDLEPKSQGADKAWSSSVQGQGLRGCLRHSPSI